MAYGLIDMPSVFQAFLNEILKEFLNLSIMIIFYSSLKVHIQELKASMKEANLRWK